MTDRSALARYIGWRIVHAVIVVIGAIIISFLLTSLSGDAAQARLGLFSTPAELRRVRIQLGLNHPLFDRLALYIGHVATANFGESFTLQKPALQVVLNALPWTVGLVAAAISLGLLLAVPAALASVVRTGRVEDSALQTVFAGLQGLPEFWLALLTTLWFSAELGWLPAIGASGPKAWVLPVVAIALPLTPTLFRLLRGELLDVMSMDFVQGLAGKGLTQTQIVIRHGLRNTAGPFVNLLCLQVGWLVGGTLIVETIFSWPGIGDLLYTSVQQRDYPIIGTIVVVIAVAYSVLNLAADLAVIALDPRVRLARVQA